MLNFRGCTLSIRPIYRGPLYPHLQLAGAHLILAFHTRFFPRAQFLLVGRLIRSHPTKDLELVREEIRNFLGAEVEKGDVKIPEPLLMAEIR